MGKLISGAGGGNPFDVFNSQLQAQRTPTVAQDSLDSRQYVNIVDLLGEGEIEGLKNGLNSVFLNDTPLTNIDGTYNFSGTSVVTTTGTQNQSAISIAPNVEEEIAVGVEVQYGTPVTRQITDQNVNAVKVTLSILQLQQSLKDGDVAGLSVTYSIDVQYDGGGFTTAITDSISGRTSDPFPTEYLINLSPGFTTVDIRVTRISVSDFKRIQTDPNVLESASAFQWTSYTEIIYAQLRYPNSALVALRLDAEQFSSIPTRSYLIRGIKVRIPNNATVDSTTGRLIYNCKKLY